MRLTEQVHLKLKKTIQPGDTAVDATAGNGHDTLLMSQLVGPSGKVFAIDLQEVAIEATRSRLENAAQLAQVELIHGDHAKILHDLLARDISASAITFNLGYLPSGDKAITTGVVSTTEALNTAQQLLRPSGILFVTAYRGHTGGPAEASEVESWMRALPNTAWHIEAKEPPTRDATRIPPILWTARKIQ